MEIVLDRTERRVPEDSRKNFTYFFTLDREYSRLKIDFSYSPKELRDELASERYIRETLRRDTPEELEKPDFDWRDYLYLKNLLTLSADFEGIYRGCHHCHPAVQQISLGTDFATTSEGFYPGPVGPGKWRIVLSAHAVVVPCDCVIRVTGYEPGEEKEASLC